MDFFLEEQEFSMILSSLSKINSHYPFLNTHSFQHFQFRKTQGTLILHFAKYTQRE